MAQFKIELQAIATAILYIEADTLQEAKDIATQAWRPRMESDNVDMTLDKVIDYDVDWYMNDPHVFSGEMMTS